jgi:hypothetical protein
MANLAGPTLGRRCCLVLEQLGGSGFVVGQGRREVLVLDRGVLDIFLGLRRYPLRPARFLRVLVVAGTMLFTGQVRGSSRLHVGRAPHPVPLEAALLLLWTHMTLGARAHTRSSVLGGIQSRRRRPQKHFPRKRFTIVCDRELDKTLGSDQQSCISGLSRSRQSGVEYCAQQTSEEDYGGLKPERIEISTSGFSSDRGRATRVASIGYRQLERSIP